MSFSENLRQQRLACRMTMESLAILVGTSRQTIQRYESGRIARPPYERIEALAAALGVTPGELMGWQSGEEQTEDALPPVEFDRTLSHIVVTDDAMDADRILERDVVYYHPGEVPPDGSLVVITWDGAPLVRRLWHTPAGVLLLASNNTYPPILVPPAESARLSILGAATVLQTLL